MIMFIVEKDKDDTFKFSYVRIINLDVVQFVKYDLENWEVAQYLGGN
jgi:hypothetical protein